VTGSQLFAPEDITTVSVTERDLLGALRARFATRAGNGPRWALACHVRDRAGFDATRTLDAIAMDTWPSSGLLLHGFEIKCSRADWRRELSDPSKAAAFTRFLDHFWIVAPAAIVRHDELPEGWGLLELRGPTLRTAVTPARLTPEPVDRSFLACLLRAATHRPADFA
jgi:hypothetical protein